MDNIKLTIAYDGTDFFGFQKTKMGPSVEETLQSVIEQILQHPVRLQAASRTDRGVHAHGQVVNYFTEKKIEMGRLRLSLNQLLPKSIAVLSCEIMPEAFHPTLDATGKEYHYHICTGVAQMPLNRFTSWHCPCSYMDLESMRKEAQFLVGTHDFSAFNLNRKESNCIRQIDEITISTFEQNRVRIVVKGKSFFYKMVRALVGTLVEVGTGKIRSIPEIMASDNRALAGVTAPAHGLILAQVFY